LSAIPPFSSPVHFSLPPYFLSYNNIFCSSHFFTEQLASHVAFKIVCSFVSTYKSTSDFALQEASPETAGGAGPEAEGGAGEDKGDYGDFYEYDYSAKQDGASPSSATSNGTITPRDVNVKCVFWLSFQLMIFLTSFKGTVRPDWICMRVLPLESPLKGYQPLYVFDFLISVLNI
jgi:hypothetical protein